MLEHDTELTTQYITQLLARGEYIATPSIFVHFLDVIMVMLTSDPAQLNKAYALSPCIERMRSAWQLSRLLLPCIVASSPIVIRPHQPSSLRWHAEMTVADVVDTLHAHFVVPA